MTDTRQRVAAWIEAAEEHRLKMAMMGVEQMREILAALTPRTESRSGLTGECYDCGGTYGDEYGFPDLLIPDWAWEAIMPGRGGGGLLCPNCIVIRCVMAGLSDVPAMWASGPLRCEPYRDGDNGGVEWLRQKEGT